MVTGGAGFIGSHLVDKLMAAGNEVIVYDNLSKGNLNFLKQHEKSKKFRFVKADLLDMKTLEKELRGVDFVYHLAANADVQLGFEKTFTDTEQGVIATYNLLEAMRKNNVKKIAFSSSQVVYGEAEGKIPETQGPLTPISLYGAGKLGAEGLMTAYCGTFGFQSWIFRFANVIGPRGTHGVIFDFIKKLKKKPKELEVLGDGKQQKQYIHVDDCVEGMVFGVRNSNDNINIFNLSSDDWIKISRIAEIVVEEVKKISKTEAKIKYTGGSRGWPGDIPKMRISSEKIRSLGWKSEYNSEESVRLTAKALMKELL
jgi:UDP-glucose 4-epimerase